MTTRLGLISAAIRDADARLEKKFMTVANFLNEFAGTTYQTHKRDLPEFQPLQVQDLNPSHQ